MLDDDELARWTSWKRASEQVWDAVGRDITAATGLSVADFSVLTRVVETRGGLRQQALADDLGWQRSRLSRQLGRMQDRGLIVRAEDGAARHITATPDGRAAAVRARRVHAVAVRRALLDRVPERQARAFWAVVEALSEPPG